MSDIAKRLRASVKFDAVNGTAHERAICGRLMLEAAREIERLQRLVEELDGQPAFDRKRSKET